MTAVEWLQEEIEKRYGLTPTSLSGLQKWQKSKP